jgi:outer membrane protein assembly factor BamB
MEETMPSAPAARPSRSRDRLPRRLRVLTLIALLAVSIVDAGVAIASPAGSTRWVATFPTAGRTGHEDPHVVVSPDGTRVYVASGGRGTAADSWGTMRTVAYDAGTGARLWAATLDTSLSDPEIASDVVVTPDGSRVLVLGQSEGGYVTVAYDAGTGAQLWLRRYRPVGLSSRPADLAVDARGRRAFVTGATMYDHGYVYATINYAIDDGSTRWVRRFDNGPGEDYARAVVVVGRTVVVTGSVDDTNGQVDMVTIGYAKRDGAVRWVRRYSPGAASFIVPAGIAAAEAGSAVWIVTSEEARAAVISYRAGDGETRWVRRLAGPSVSGGSAVVAAPDGGTVWISGLMGAGASGGDLMAAAFDGATGARRWLTRYDGPAADDDAGTAITATRDGSRVWVAGYSTDRAGQFDFATVALGGADGSIRWVRRFDGGAGKRDEATSIALAGDGASVVVTGWSRGLSGNLVATISYEG